MDVCGGVWMHGCMCGGCAFLVGRMVARLYVYVSSVVH